jgi:hypothetical protein
MSKSMTVEATGGEMTVCPPVGGEAVATLALHSGKVARGVWPEWGRAILGSPALDCIVAHQCIPFQLNALEVTSSFLASRPFFYLS